MFVCCFLFAFFFFIKDVGSSASAKLIISTEKAVAFIGFNHTVPRQGLFLSPIIVPQYIMSSRAYPS